MKTLIDRYGPWGEHPEHPVSDWLHEVANNSTRRGYWEWVSAHLDSEVTPALNIKLMDWQAADGEAFKGPEVIDLDIKILPDRVEIFEMNSHRGIWIELQDGDLKVRTYDDVREEPCTTTIPATGMQTYEPRN